MPHQHQTSKLTEGMREGDLADLVLPLISVDEYQSNVADESEAIVFGFYVHDQDAADDLNRFLQKSAAPILDTEVSPAPDQRGYFMVFVELANDSRMTENIEDVLAEMKALVDIDEWQMRVRDLPDLISFTPKNLMRALKASTSKVQERAILWYLQKSALNEAMIDDGLLILQGSGERFVFDVVGFGPLDDLLVEHKLTEAGVSYHPRSIARSDRVARILGEGWSVCELNRLMVLQRAEETHGLLLRG